MKTLYQNTVIIKRLNEYFAPYISLLTKPSGQKMFLLLLSMLGMQFATSINHLYKWFLSKISDKSLNSYYYLLTYTEIALDSFFKITVGLAVSLIPKELQGLPVFLIIDDTLQEKYGTHFEGYQTMFDHAKHNGSSYLKGHCFVALTIRVPVTVGNEIRYLNVPVGFRMHKKPVSKMETASKMIDTAMETLKEYPMVILLCDSWYPKGKIIETVKKHANLELIANTRVDSCLYDLPAPPAGKRGRPRKRGEKLDIYTDFHFIRVEDYFIATKTVLTNLFESVPIYLMVTAPDITKHNTYRLFMSTVSPDQLRQYFRSYEKKLSDTLPSQMLWLLPLYLYSFRWAIEVMFYEQKTFWSFGLYRVRSVVGIENFVNLSSICYACMQMLPFMDVRFSNLINDSPQTRKYHIGDAIRCELFFWRFAAGSETPFNSLLLFYDFASLGHLDFLNLSS